MVAFCICQLGTRLRFNKNDTFLQESGFPNVDRINKLEDHLPFVCCTPWDSPETQDPKTAEHPVLAPWTLIWASELRMPSKILKHLTPSISQYKPLYTRLQLFQTHSPTMYIQAEKNSDSTKHTCHTERIHFAKRLASSMKTTGALRKVFPPCLVAHDCWPSCESIAQKGARLIFLLVCLYFLLISAVFYCLFFQCCFPLFIFCLLISFVVFFCSLLFVVSILF